MLQSTNEQQILTDSFFGRTKIIHNHKLNLFGKGIDKIDIVACRQQIMETIHEVDLSHNVIAVTNNLQQFKNVQIINLSHNLIENAEEIYKLKTLPKLHTLFIKGNTFINKNMHQSVLLFLLSLETDIQLVNEAVQAKIDEITSAKKQIELFFQYLNKVNLHIQLTNTFQLEDTFVNTQNSMFETAKRYLPQMATQNMLSKRQWFKKIQPNLLLNDNNLMLFLRKQLEERKLQRTKIVKKILDRQQLLRNLRNTCNIGLNSKRYILKKDSVNQNHQNQLCESQIIEQRGHINSLNSVIKLQASKNASFQSSIKKTNTLKESTPKLLFQFKQIKTNEQFEKIFIPTLCKINNLYHLLHSPLQSLKSHEKELLIHSLITLLKQKLKDIYKYEKIQQQNQKTKMEFNCLQKHMLQISSEIKEEKQRFKRQLQKMQNIYQRQAEKVQQLCQDVALYERQIQILTQTNGKLMFLQNRQNLDNNNEQIIINRHRKLLKLKYFRLIKHKSIYFSNLKRLTVINHITQNQRLVDSTFKILKINMEVNLKRKKLKQIFMKRRFEQFSQFLLHSYQINKFKSNLISQLTIRRKICFLHKISRCFKQNLENKSKIHIFQRHLNKSLKINTFIILRLNAQQSKEQISNQTLIPERTEIILKRYLYLWKRYIKEFKDKTINCKKRIKGHYLSLFIDKQKGQIKYYTSFAALSYFLENVRKINTLHRFTKTVSSTLFCRKIKLFKIIKYKQQVYLNYFISSMKDFMLKRKIYVQQEMERLQLLKRQKQTNREQDTKKLKIKRAAFKIYFKNAANKIINKILIRQNKQIKLSQQNQFFSIKSFYNNLRNRYILSLKMSIQANRLAKIPFILNKLKHFYYQLSLNNNRMKKQTKNKAEKTLLKIFYKWKAYVLWSRQQNYKNRYHQLQPQINRISELQKQVVDQNNILLRSLSDRQLEIQIYIKKCEEYQYLLQSKQIKYEKLRNIYQNSLERSIQHSKTPKKSDNRKSDLSNRQNIYIKYLPEDKRLEAMTKHTYQQQDHKSRYEEKRQSFLANFKNNYIERLEHRHLQTNNRVNDIPSFKLF